MIGKIFKFIGYTILILIISLLIFVNTALFDKFLENRLKEQVLFTTGLELSFSKFYVSFFKGKLLAENIKLSNALTIKKIDLDIKSSRLLFAKLDIERARVYGVSVNIDRDFKIKSFSKNPKKLDKSGFESLIIRDFRLENVSVKFSDREGNVASFVSKDFLIQAGFNAKDGTYSGVIAFNNGQVVYNNNPYLLNVACYFDFNENSITIKELSISSGGLKIKSKGKFAKGKSEISIKGKADLFKLTKVEELKNVTVAFNLNGDVNVLKGDIFLTDGKRKAKGFLTINIPEKKVSVKNLSGNFKDHFISLDGNVSFKKKLKIALEASIKGKFLKNFHVNLDIEKAKEWNYNARFYGVDCGNGVCGVKVISGKIPKLSTVKLNLPILKTDIENNSGWIDLNLKQARVFAHGDFFKNGNLFSGLLTVKKLNLLGLNFPKMDANLTIKSKDYVVFDSILLKDGEGTAKLKGEFKNNKLNIKAKLNDFPFKKALFFLDKETLDQIEIFGAVEGDLNISGKYDNPEVEGSVTLLHSNIYGLYFSSVNSDFLYKNSVLKLDNTILEAGDGFMKGGGKINFDNEKIDLKFKGKDIELNYIPLEDLYAENSTGQVKIFGTLSDLKIDSNFSIQDVVFSDLSFGAGDFSLSMRNNDINLDFILKNGLSGKGIIKNGEEMDFNFKANKFIYNDGENSVVVSGEFGFTGKTDDLNTLSGSGKINSLEVKKGELFNLQAKNADFKMQGMVLTSSKLILTQSFPQLRIDMTNINLNIDKDEISSDLKFSGDAALVNNILKDQEIEGVSVNGELNGNFKLYGIIYSPFYSGDLGFKGSVDLKDAGYFVENANLKVTVDYDVFEIKNFYGKIKNGSINVSGTIIGSNIDLQAKVDSIPVDIPGFYADASGLVFLKSLTEEGRYSASGYLELKNGVLNVEQMLSGESEESFLDNVELDLKVSLEGVTYSDPDITLLFGKSNLKMRGSAANPVLSGVQLISKDSFLNIGNNRFYVERGRLVFNNPLENTPYVNIVASADLNNYRVRCFLKGSADKINIKFASDPPLSQNKILSVLFGGGINTGIYDFFHTGAEENLSGVGAALALNTLLSSFNSKMRKTLKVDRFFISSQVFDVTRSPSPVMSFEKDLSSRLSFLYAQSLDTGGNLIELSYHMAGKRNIYIRNEIDGSVTLEFEIIK
ncbi:hypothetical protein TTHT_0078 [Thermotomaculum hydrothermale]|uniref:Translocation and assembly module TamB C-terminal domain-containing protein n=1 Tax=Thermotomaculum hydrothermale TaxID=981385 RepID=A0A7R6SYH2_9BACT|nr:translocation/assembly module TamB domain-containing protein [Thermotomaculum hydrothermale]BBB31727.1 hypothetical protein TTHT_0078 [Thermotomaculum hydrothermale]